MDNHGLTQFKLEQDDTKLELKKGGDLNVEAVQKLIASAPPVVSSPPAIPSTGAGAGSAPEGEQGLPEGVEEITAPMVGTFYVASKPEADPFVKVGDKISPETTVCIIEAMKVMNNIEAGIKGEVVEVLVENGSPVQYAEPLFRVKTS